MANPNLDLTKDFADVVGDPEVRYMQDFHFFNSAGVYVREAPEFHKNGAKKQVLDKRAQKAAEMIEAARRAQAEADDELAALDAAGRTLEQRTSGGASSAPKTLVDAARENAAALRAEQELDE